MNFNLDFPFDEEDDISMDAEMRFPGKSLIHPPIAEFRPLSLILKVGDQLSLSNYFLKDILKNPTSFSTKTNASSPGSVSESPYLEFDDASPILQTYLKEIGLSKMDDLQKGLDPYESISFELTQLRNIALEKSLTELEQWLFGQKIETGHSLVQKWQSDPNTSLFIALSVGKMQALRIHLQPKNEDLIENAASDIKIKFGANKQITFSGSSKPTIAVQLCELLQEDEKIIIKDPSKGGGGGRGGVNPSG